MQGQLRNEIGKRAVASCCDAAADEELVTAAKKSSFSTWLTRIAINEALMSLRRRRALHEVPVDDSSGEHGTTPGPDLADASPDPEATYLQKGGARIVSTAIRHLRPGMRKPSSCGNGEQYQKAIPSYQQTVQNPFEQVSNSLVASQKDREFREQQELLTQAARQTNQLSGVLYKNGGATIARRRMATVMSGGDAWIGFPVNHLSTMPVSGPVFGSPVNLYCFQLKRK